MHEDLVRMADQVRRIVPAGVFPGSDAAREAEEAVVGLLADLHPADLAELLDELDPGQRLVVFRALDPERAALTLGELDDDLQAELLRALEDAKASGILEEMPADEIADLVGEMPEPQADRVLDLMEREDRADVEELLEFRPDSAGGLMTPDYIAVRESDTVQDAIDTLRRLAPDAETAYYLYVVDARETLVGVVSLRELIIAPPSTLVGEIMKRKVIAVNVHEDQEEVARRVAKYNLLAMPVVDDAGRLRGIVTVDDVIDVVQEEATEDIYKLAGTGEVEQDVAAGTWRRAKRRLPWLVGLLFGELLASQVIQHYDETLEAITALAFFIPVLIGMGGNVATQSLAVTVRGLATGEIDRRALWRWMGREVLVGLAVGAACGAVVFGVAWAWRPVGLDPALMGLIVGIAMALDMIAAAALGALFPFLLDRFGVDPAVASGPFVTTVMDVFGMLIYFAVATSLLALAGASGSLG